MFDLETAHKIWRYSHVVVGTIGLVAFWIPVFARKGSRLHIRAGKLFVWCGYFVEYRRCLWVALLRCRCEGLKPASAAPGSP